MSESIIDGIWESAGYVGEPRIYDEEVLFFDGKFLFIFRDLSAIPVGVESGTFEVTAEGELNVELDFDGLWNSDRTRDGWDNGGSTIGLGLDLNDNSTELVIAKETTLSKVESSTLESSVFGAWKVEGKDILAAHDTYLLFLDDGVLATATPINQLGYSTYTGLEFGTYEYSSIEQQLTISYQYDGAILNSVDNGFSPLGNNFTITPSGENYILTAEASGSSFPITNLFGARSLADAAGENYQLAETFGTAAGDQLIASTLPEVIDGGDGIDTVIYSSSKGTIQKSGDSYLVNSDTLINVERIQFSDANIALDVDGATSAGGVYRLYQATFARTPDTEGFGFWLAAADNGLSAQRMAEDFTMSAEFQTLYGVDTTDLYFSGEDIETIINGLYNNILGRDPDEEGFNFWVNVVRDKIDTLGGVLTGFSEEEENYNNTIGTIQNGMEYDLWVG